MNTTYDSIQLELSTNVVQQELLLSCAVDIDSNNKNFIWNENWRKETIQLNQRGQKPQKNCPSKTKILDFLQHITHDKTLFFVWMPNRIKSHN